ncbi:MAG: hypothetical protein JHC31_12420 [Sulfurihydrogenibium sp.]|nr:hypothetical protein [Sulfurihydrogenibium sp.]
MSKAKILRNIEEVKNSAINTDNSKFVRIIVRSIPQEQDFLLDMWNCPERYEYCYLLPLLDNDKIRIPPWFNWREDSWTECRIVDENGHTLSYIELPEPVYLYRHFRELERKKKENRLTKRIFRKILSLFKL